MAPRPRAPPRPPARRPGAVTVTQPPQRRGRPRADPPAAAAPRPPGTRSRRPGRRRRPAAARAAFARGRRGSCRRGGHAARRRGRGSRLGRRGRQDEPARSRRARPDRLREALLVVLDQADGAREDRRRAAVVDDEVDAAQAGQVGGEPEHPPDVGQPPAVDRSGRRRRRGRCGSPARPAGGRVEAGCDRRPGPRRPAGGRSGPASARGGPRRASSARSAPRDEVVEVDRAGRASARS